MKILAFMSAILLAGTTQALADQPGDGEGSQITYEEALQKCAEFVNDPQLVTIEFKVGCFDESLEWKQTGTAKVTHEQTGQLGHNLIMKEKWYTPDFAIPVVKKSVESECPVLAQFKTARQASLVLSCEDFVEQYQDPAALAARCEQALAEASPQTQPTGAEVNVCGGQITE